MSEFETDPRAKAVAAAALVEYQAGAVVSRQILKGKTGTVTAFAFDAEEGLSEHSAPFDALVHVVEGEARVTISGQPHVLRQGDLIVMPANEPHALHAPQRFKMILTMIRS